MASLPTWLKDAIFYEIYPQSFLDTDSDGIGNLQGIIRKLDYIRELGCNALWLNPCFASPFADAGYDVADYCRIAPRYGSNDDARELFEQAHRRGMHVILDLVPGHTSMEHPWFRESLKREKNEFTHRYVWTDSVWEAPQVGNISGWLRGISSRDGACAVNFFSAQPALNYGFCEPTESWQLPMDHPAALATGKAMEDVVRFWLDLGCDGFRVDMASSLIKNDPEHKGIVAFWQRFFASVCPDYPQAAFVSEWGDPYYSLQAGFHMDFLLHFGPSHYLDLFREKPYFAQNGGGDVSRFVETYRMNMEKTNGLGLMCLPSGNHDMVRLAHTLTDGERRLAFAFLLSMPGAPFLYYGDEIGMRYLPEVESVEGGYFRTGSRSPMQWDGSVTAGFSAAPPDTYYIPLDPDPARPNVRDAMADKDSLWWEIHRLIDLRRAHSALGVEGGIEFLYAEKEKAPFVYLRSSPEERILVAINPTAEETSVNLPLENGTPLYAVGGQAILAGGRLTVPAGSASFLSL